MSQSQFSKILPFSLLATALALGLFTAAAPLEKTLGANARLVYLHGAWVWTAILTFLAAAATGLAGLVLHRERWHTWSQAAGRAGLLLWVTFLPQSLYLMQANWNGLFLDEPRFRTPLNLAVIAVLLQVGLAFFPIVWTSVGNLLFGLVFMTTMNGLETILHPDSPIVSSNSAGIRLFFIVLLLLLSAGAFQLTFLLAHRAGQRSQFVRPASGTPDHQSPSR